MNNYSLNQLSRTGSLDSNLTLRQYKFDLMTRFLEMKSTNLKLFQKEIAKQIGFSDSTLSQYRKDKKLMSIYKSTNSNKRQKNVTDCPNTSKYVTDLREASQNVTGCQNTSKCVTDRRQTKSNLKGGSIIENDNHIPYDS